MATSKKPRWKELLEATDGYEQVVVITHDNPDPDAIAAGWGVRLLLKRKSKAKVQLVGGGGIVRAENRHMLNLLKPPIELVHQFNPRKRTAAVFVDCTPASAGHLASDEHVDIVGVIDHHLTTKPPRRPFVDIRPRMAAAATMVAGYLRECGIKPSRRLATAMLYAVRTETCGNEFHHTKQDRYEIQWLTPFSNPEWLAEIENAPLERNYFADMVLALQNTFMYGDSAFCLLPRAEGQEVVGEVADLLIRCKGVNRVFCGAVVGADLSCSVRTQKEGDNAAKLVRNTLEGLGFGGGHHHRAGGKVKSIPHRRITESLEEELRSRWLKSCKSSRKRGTRLIAKKEIEGTLRRKSRI